VASALRSARRSAVRALAVAALRARVVAAFLPAVERRVLAAFVVAAGRLLVERLAERVPVERPVERLVERVLAERVPVERPDAERLLAERVEVRLRAAVERRAGAFVAAGLAALLLVVVLGVPVVSAMGSVLPGDVCKELTFKCYDVSVAIEHTFVNLDRGAVTARASAVPARCP
jgi:hypothetical protein